MAENRKVDNNKKWLNNRSLKLSWFSLKLAAPPCKKKDWNGQTNNVYGWQVNQLIGTLKVLIGLDLKHVLNGTVGVLVSTSQRLISAIGAQPLTKKKFLKQSFQNFFNVKGERGYWILDFLLYWLRCVCLKNKLWLFRKSAYTN